MVPDSTSASTATAELDDLMTSLNNFKMDERNVDEPVIGGAPNLDDMLGRVRKLREERKQILKDMAMLKDAFNDSESQESQQQQSKPFSK